MQVLYLRAWQVCLYLHTHTVTYTLFYIHNVHVCASVLLKYYLKDMLLVATDQQESLEL